MKKLLSILIVAFFLSNIVTYAQKENNPFTEIALIQAKEKIRLVKEIPLYLVVSFKPPTLTYIIIRYVSTSTRYYPLSPSSSSMNQPVKPSMQKHAIHQQISAST